MELQEIDWKCEKLVEMKSERDSDSENTDKKFFKNDRNNQRM